MPRRRFGGPADGMLRGVDIKEQLDLLMAGTEYGDGKLAGAMRRELGDRLAEGRPLTAYLGVDPTSPNIHLGHCVVLEKLATFQRLGHRVIFVIGDFTAQIGDPTGRSKTRPPLTGDQVAANAATYADQAFRVLDRSRTELVYNSQWLAGTSLKDVIALTREFTLAQLLTREDFGQRHAAGAPIHLHEFLYALMQGQDAAHLRTDVQLGGTDQLFNILTGRDVMRNQGLKPQVPVIMPLLPGLDGKVKMSKSHGNDIGIAAEPADMYGKVMSLPDDAMPTYFRLVSGLEPAGAERRIAEMASGVMHARDAKMELARRIVARWHGEAKAGSAEAAFVAQFQRGGAPDDCPELSVARGIDAVALVLACGAARSRAEAKRLIDQGGLSLDGKRIEGWGPVDGLADGGILRAGKRHLYTILVTA
jgi:tyrosyl-tRNA synthetase